VKDALADVDVGQRPGADEEPDYSGAAGTIRLYGKWAAAKGRRAIRPAAQATYWTIKYHQVRAAGRYRRAVGLE
jgi:hypothetical protein